MNNIQQALDHLEQAVALSKDQVFVKKLKRASKANMENIWVFLACVGLPGVMILAILGVQDFYPEYRNIIPYLLVGIMTMSCVIPLALLALFPKTKQKAKRSFLMKKRKTLYDCEHTGGGIMEPATQQNKLRVMEKLKQINQADDFWPLVERSDIPNGWWLVVEEFCDEDIASQTLLIGEELATDRLMALQWEEENVEIQSKSKRMI